MIGLREFKTFCDITPQIANLLADLPSERYDFDIDWRNMPEMWPGGLASYGMRWDAICQMVEGGTSAVESAWLQLSTSHQSEGLFKVTDIFVRPIYNYILDNLNLSSTMLYLLLRYKRKSEWFNVARLRRAYLSKDTGGEEALDEDIREFLFDAGVD